ncbi:unnamed protein product [Calypogeia fissa]
MTRLWQAVLTIPASTASCERGFSTQNYIKSSLRSSLNLDTLEAHMRVLMAKMSLELVDFDSIWAIWNDKKSYRRFRD